MKACLSIFLVVVLLGVWLSGCSKDYPDQLAANKSPRTFLWLFPDSSLAQGNSKQRIRWWGEDPDGVVRGYLFASGKFLRTAPVPDSTGWVWTTKNDTLIAFPLLIKQDTFDVAVRAVDNSFLVNLPEHAMIRWSPTVYWDKNSNGLFDGGDVELPTLLQATDRQGARLQMPLLNQPPSLVFAQNPNDPSVTMQQPETTFTAATFSWVGSDPDGDATIASYEMALNDTSDPNGWFIVPANIKLVSLVVPRERSDTASTEVSAEVYAGVFNATRNSLGLMPRLRLNALNTFYVRARDLAGDVSPVIRLPKAGDRWFVKKPVGRLLIISDYIGSDSAAALQLYRTVLPQVNGGRFANVEVLNIARGLNAQQKKENRFGTLVPPFINPAFIHTLHLFDVVLWYTDQFPSLGVAQYPLFQYVRDGVHPGKVIFTTMFESASDPRAALKDFAPIDSIGSVDLNAGRLLPSTGDTRIPSGYSLLRDSTDPVSNFPTLTFGSIPPRVNFSVFLRPIYRRPDAKYIYRIQDDVRVPQRYAYTSGLNDLRTIGSSEGDLWACGGSGVILYSNNLGQSWERQKSGVTYSLNGLTAPTSANVWTVGDLGTILQSTDRGVTWVNRSVLTFENLLDVQFPTPTIGIIVGTRGLLIRTTNGGSTWNSPSIGTRRTVRSVRFVDANVGIAVGDSGLVLKTTDGGASWRTINPVTIRQLNNIEFASASTAFAVGAAGSILRSTDGGESWSLQSSFTAVDLRSVSFSSSTQGATCGGNGVLFQTLNGGSTWNASGTGISQVTGNGQTLNDVTFGSSGSGIWAAATGGVIVASLDGGASWATQPRLPINVGVIDGLGRDGKRSFVFIGLPLHLLNGDGTNIRALLETILIDEFGF